MTTEMDGSTTTLADAVRHRRVMLGLSQVAAAAAAGVSRRAWNEIELGYRQGTPETLAKMDAALQLPDGSLLAYQAKPPEPLAAIRRQLIDIIDTFTTREQLSEARAELARLRLTQLTSEVERMQRLGSGIPDGDAPD